MFAAHDARRRADADARATEAEAARDRRALPEPRVECRREVELDFKIDDVGKVDNVEVGGVGDVNSCVSIIKDIEFAER